jgi:hypothetical protein
MKKNHYILKQKGSRRPVAVDLYIGYFWSIRTTNIRILWFLSCQSLFKLRSISQMEKEQLVRKRRIFIIYFENNLRKKSNRIFNIQLT